VTHLRLSQLVPRSLRRQLTIVLAALAGLVMASSLTAIQALRASAEGTRGLAEERLVRMQEAQDLVRDALLVERGLDELVAADDPERLRTQYAEVLRHLGALDGLVDRLGGAGAGDPAVLELHRASQLFRNTCHVLARLREDELADRAAPAAARVDRSDTLRRFHAELRRQTVAMLASAQLISDHLTAEYRDAVARLAATARASARRVAALLAGSLVLAWLAWRQLLQKRVLDRLQAVSDTLRQGKVSAQVPVRGADEIGEMARAVERFLEDRHRLAEANRELEALSYSVSHDLRAPIRHVDGFVTLLRDRAEPALDDRSRHFLDAIAEAAHRMGTLVDDLLSFLRMRSAEMVIARVELEPLAREVVADLAAQAGDRAVEWIVGELPVIDGDREMLRLALRNLVGNALKFTRPHPRARIEIGSGRTPAEREVVIFVRDDGVGFDAAHADKLFRVFHRLHRVEDFAGTGIGLANVRRIVERHGGRTWAEGAPGRGATVFLAFPRPRSSPGVATSSPPPSPHRRRADLR
jgi:signal transduction histidine kinase